MITIEQLEEYQTDWLEKWETHILDASKAIAAE